MTLLPSDPEAHEWRETIWANNPECIRWWWKIESNNPTPAYQHWSAFDEALLRDYVNKPRQE